FPTRRSSDLLRATLSRKGRGHELRLPLPSPLAPRGRGEGGEGRLSLNPAEPSRLYGSQAGMSSKKAAKLTNNARASRRTIRIGVIGLGTVGTGTVKVLLEHWREVERRLGCKLELKFICSRSIRKRDLSWLGQPVEITADWKQVVRHPEVDIVVEL